MTISIDWPTRVITIPKSFLTFVSADTFQLDSNQFRLALKDLEADPNEGLSYPFTHNHNTEVVISGTTIARVIELTNGYTVTFEDGQYRVNVFGANTNIGDVVNFNQVQVSTSNSAGLQIVSVGSGLSIEQSAKLDSINENVSIIKSIIEFVRKYITNRTKINSADKSLTLYDDDQVTPLVTHDLKDSKGLPSIEVIHERIPR